MNNDAFVDGVVVVVVVVVVVDDVVVVVVELSLSVKREIVS